MPRIYPEGGTANINDRRWEVEWYVMKTGVGERLKRGDDFDPDNDQYAAFETFPFEAHEKARARAQQLCDDWDALNMPMAIVTVQEQVCRWFERDMNLAEWESIGEAEYFDEPVGHKATQEKAA